MTSSWMIVAGFLFATMAVLVKLGADQFDAAELGLYRSLAGLLFVLGLVRVNGGTLRSRYMGQHMVRGFVGAVSLIGYFYSIAQLPLATAQTLNYTSPLFLAIATIVVMGERFSPWLLVAILLGFAGVAILLQPTFEHGKAAPALIGLFCGVLSAWAYLSVRTLGRLGEPDWRVLFWFTVVASILCAGWQAATSNFHPVRWDNAWILAGIGICGTFAQLAMTRAYRTGNTLVVGALSYSTLVFSAVFTYIVWHQRLTPMEWIGMGVIVLSGILAMRFEKKEQVEEGGFEG
jgi:drug/metabolite transporter (DMT)-like permease